MSDTPADDQNDKRESGRDARKDGAGDRREDRGRPSNSGRAERGGSGRDGRAQGGGYSRGAAPRAGQSGGRGANPRDGQGASGGGRGSAPRDGQRSGVYRAGAGSQDGQRSSGYRGAGAPRDGARSGGYRGGQGGGGRDGQARDEQKRGGFDRDKGRGGSNGQRDGQRPGGGRGGRDEKLWTREGQPARNDRDARDQERELTEEERMARELRSVRARHDDPEVPDDVEARDLDKGARVELKTLSKENADWVAQHLVMAARLIDEDPELAHQHATSAARRAGRIGVVRETLAITAYATGDFALALRELRTYRRISGSNDQLPLMVDSERGVGRSDRALELGRSVERSTLPNDVQVSLAIAMSGARLDLDQIEAALAELEIPQLDPNRAFSWSPDLFHAYADVLEELGREDQAETWRERAARAEEAIGAALTNDEHETVDVVEEEFEIFEVDGEDSFAISSGDSSSGSDDESESDASDGTVSTDH